MFSISKYFIIFDLNLREHTDDYCVFFMAFKFNFLILRKINTNLESFKFASEEFKMIKEK